METKIFLKYTIYRIMSALFLSVFFAVYICVPVYADQTMDDKIKESSQYVYNMNDNPGYTDIWNVIALKRYGYELSDEYTGLFYKNIVTYLKQKDWNITSTTYSDYSKIILGLTAVGVDARDVAGHNLFYYLSDFKNVAKQGINGVDYALIALNSNDLYEISINADATVQNSEDMMIEYILGKELDGGGWALSGTSADSDITAITLIALSSYYGSDDKITAAVDRAIDVLSLLQQDDGSYKARYTGQSVKTAESCAQVLTALSALGIDGKKDARFVKDGKSLIDALLSFSLEDGSYSHVLEGDTNNIATTQAFYAFVSYYRMIENKTFLFDMSDVALVSGEDIEIEEVSEDYETENDTQNEGTVKDEEVDASQDDELSKIESPSVDATINTDLTKENTDENTEKEDDTATSGWQFSGEDYLIDEDDENIMMTDNEHNNNIVIIIGIAAAIAGAGYAFIFRDNAAGNNQ